MILTISILLSIYEVRSLHVLSPISHSLPDYNAIDLPVFTCSSRDYVRIKGRVHFYYLSLSFRFLLTIFATGQVKGDGEPTCFTNVEDTGIPGLQRWCHELTVASRERAARSFLSQLKAFITGVGSYVRGISDVTPADRESLRERWESNDIYAGEENTSIKGVAPVLLQVCQRDKSMQEAYD